MVAKISFSQFVANSKTYAKGEGGLSHAICAILQAQARIAASAVTALTDSSGGATANGTIEAIGSFTKAVVGSTDAAQKAELEASFANITDAFKELIAQANAIHAKVPALDGVLVDSITGTAVDGTIGAIDATMTGVGTSMASAAGANAVLANIKNAVSQLVYHVNKLAVACGVTPIVDLSGGKLSFGLTFADISEGTGTAASGADTTDANAIVKATDAGTVLGKAANAVKEIATVLNSCRNATGGTLSAVAKA